MKRSAVRVAAAILAACISVSELAAIASLADYLAVPDEAVAVLPRTIVTPQGRRGGVSAETPRAALAAVAPLERR